MKVVVARPVLLLIGVSLLFWAVAVYLACLVAADPETRANKVVLPSAAAALLCLVPAAATLAWASRPASRSPEQRLLMVLGGTGLRMVFVLGAGFVLCACVQALHRDGFWIWTLVFYLFTLALEMALLLHATPTRDPH